MTFHPFDPSKPITKMAKELADEFRKRNPEDWALHEACEELLILQRRLMDAERRQSAGYMRRSPSHRSRQPKPVLADPVDDDWITTGRERNG